MSEFFELLGYILIFGSILFLAYVAARYISHKTAAAMKTRHMQVIDQISLGLDKRLFLVRVGSEYFLFLSGKKEFCKVAKIDLENEEEESDYNESGFSFRRIFDIYNNKRQSESGDRKTEFKKDKAEVLRKNIKRLEELRVKSNDKEV